MKLLFDMNLAPAWVEVVKAQGTHIAQHWSNVGLPTAPDTEIMRYAREHAWIVITSDLDFGAILAATHAQSPSVVQLRADDVRPQVIANSVLRAIEQFEPELLSGALLTVEPERARVRLLPFASRS